MSLDNYKKEALARLRSPTGQLSGHTPEFIVFRGERLALWVITNKEKTGELEEKEEIRLIGILRSIVLEQEKKIEHAGTEEEVEHLLEEALGARRVLMFLEKRYSEEYLKKNKRDDARRWIGFSKKIKGS